MDAQTVSHDAASLQVVLYEPLVISSDLSVDAEKTQSQGDSAQALDLQRACAVECSMVQQHASEVADALTLDGSQWQAGELPLNTVVCSLQPEHSASQVFAFSLENQNETDENSQSLIGCNFLTPCPISKIPSADKIISTSEPFHSLQKLKDNISDTNFRPTVKAQFGSNFSSSNKGVSVSDLKGLQGFSNGVLPIALQGMNATKERRSFAQVVAPPAVTETIPIRGTTPECGILVERQRGSSMDDYAKAIELVVGKNAVVFIGQAIEDSAYVMAFLERPPLVELAVNQGIKIKGRWLCVTHLQQPASKLVVSDVMPFIPDSAIIEACKTFGSSVHPSLRRIPAATRSQEFKNVYSYRRELLIVIDKDKIVPDSITVFSYGRFYTLPLSHQGIACFRCKRVGHKIANCKQPPVNKFSRDVPPPPSTKHQYISDATPLQDPNLVLTTGVGMKQKSTDGQLKSTVSAGLLAPSGAKDGGGPNGSMDTLDFLSWTSAPFLPNDSLAWKEIGKKGRVLSMAKGDKKVQKIPNSQDVASFRVFSQRRESSSSPELSDVEEGGKQHLESSGKQVGSAKRKMGNKQPSPSSQDHPSGTKQGTCKPKVILQTEGLDTTMEPQYDQIPTDSVKKDLLGLGVKSIPSKTLSKKSGTSFAHSVVTSLLNTLKGLRGAKRRSVLEDFDSKYPMLANMIDQSIQSLPTSTPGSQDFKTLSRIKQDLKAKPKTMSKETKKKEQ